MAQYIKFRLTAAKVGVSMALAALIAGIAEKVQAAPTVIRAKPAAVDYFLKLDGIGGQTKTAFQKVELKYLKLNTALLKLENQLSTIYHKDTINAKFLKIDAANAEFLKLDTASAEYLKIDFANINFLKIDATAANSNELGGKTPDAFFQGHGNVVSGEATVTGGQQPQPLLATPDGAISIKLGFVTDGGHTFLTITNGTGNALPAVQDLGETPPVGTSTSPETTSSNPLPTGSSSIDLGAGGSQLHLQIFPAGSFNQVVTITVSTEANGNGATGVGQMLIGQP